MGLAIERRFAEAARLHVGDTVRVSSSVAGSRPARVEAIYEPVPDPATIMRRDFHVRLHLADLAALAGLPDRVDRIGVVLRPGVGVDSAAARLNRTAFGYDVFPSRAIASQSSMTFVVVSRFHRAIAIISVLASTVFLLCLMLLKVEERRRDVAMLRFTGISRRTVFMALVLEAAVIALAGSIVGAGIGAVASAVVNAYYQRAFDTVAGVFRRSRPAPCCFAVGLSVVLGRRRRRAGRVAHGAHGADAALEPGSMTWRWALRDLLRHRARTALSLLGVAIATALLLDMVLLSGGIERSFGQLLVSRGFQLRVSPRGTLPFDTDASARQRRQLLAHCVPNPAWCRLARSSGRRRSRGVAPHWCRWWCTASRRTRRESTNSNVAATSASPTPMACCWARRRPSGSRSASVTRSGWSGASIRAWPPRRIERVVTVRGMVRFVYDAKDQPSVARGAAAGAAARRRDGGDRASFLMLRVE